MQKVSTNCLWLVMLHDMDGCFAIRRVKFFKNKV